MVSLVASPIGLSGKAGMRERERERRDWNKKTEKNREGIPVAWHGAPKEAWPAVCLQCTAVRNKLSPRSLGLRSVDLQLFLLFISPLKQFLTQSNDQKKKVFDGPKVDF